MGLRLSKIQAGRIADLFTKLMAQGARPAKKAPSANWKSLQAVLPSKKKNRAYAAASASLAKDGAPVMGPSTSGVAKGESQKLLEVLSKGSEGLTDAKRSDPGKYLAIDCEMVGVGERGSESVLGRVSVVNYYGAVVYDTFVRPQEKVSDLRTFVSGIRQRDIEHAPDFKTVTERVAKLIDGKIVIGHAISNEFKALRFNHPKQLVRDTQLYAPLQKLAGSKRPALKKLVKQLLDVDIQSTAHSSVDDARATMAIYRTQKVEWERSMQSAPAAKSFTQTTIKTWKSPSGATHTAQAEMTTAIIPAVGSSKDLFNETLVEDEGDDEDEDADPLTINTSSIATPRAKGQLALNLSPSKPPAQMPRRGEKMDTLGLVSIVKELEKDEAGAEVLAREVSKKRKREGAQRSGKRAATAEKPHRPGGSGKEWWEEA